MGIAASQARMLMLTARKSNIEFQGQQINQQRTTLANQSASYNSQLLGLTVPTAPSSSEYTSTAYSFSMNGNNCSIAPRGIIYNESTGKYTIPYTYDTTEPQAESAGSKTFKSTNGVYTLSNNNSLAPLNSTDNASELSQLNQNLDLPKYTLSYDSNGNTSKDAIADLVKVNVANTTEKASLKAALGSDPDANETYYKYTTVINGASRTSYVKASELASVSTASSSTASSIPTYYLDDSVDSAVPATVTADIRSTEFYSFASNYGVSYVSVAQVQKSAVATAEGNNANVPTYRINDEASVTKTEELQNAQVVWAESGRIASITDESGVPIKLSTTTSTDEAAYDEAMNQYEYDKQVYEQSINNINARLDIVQQQDKTLELQLTQLDTEQKAVSTEEEAVKKVLEKNAEAFKTFA